MLTIDLDEFMFELKGGTIKHVGASNNAATAKLYDVESTEIREFGDQLKLACADDSGNEVEIALDPATARDIADSIDQLTEDRSSSQ